MQSIESRIRYWIILSIAINATGGSEGQKISKVILKDLV